MPSFKNSNLGFFFSSAYSFFKIQNLAGSLWQLQILLFFPESPEYSVLTSVEPSADCL